MFRVQVPIIQGSPITGSLAGNPNERYPNGLVGVPRYPSNIRTVRNSMAKESDNHGSDEEGPLE
jgi:hypothetical protein